MTIDTIYIPAQKSPDKLLIVSSGVPGVEGFVGSAVQQMFIAEILPDVNVGSGPGPRRRARLPARSKRTGAP